MGREHGLLHGCPCLDSSWLRQGQVPIAPSGLHLSLSLLSSLSLHCSLSLCSSKSPNPKTELGRDVRLPPHGSSPQALVALPSSALSLSLATREESSQGHRGRPHGPLLPRRPAVRRRAIRAFSGRASPPRRAKIVVGELLHLAVPVSPSLVSKSMSPPLPVVVPRGTSSPASLGWSPEAALPVLSRP